MAPDQRPSFPTYLLPSFTFPFRRRQSSTSEPAENSIPSLCSSPTSSTGTSPSSSPPNPHFLPISPVTNALKGLLHAALQNEPKSKPEPKRERLSIAQPNTLKCGACATDIAFASQIVSKGFTGRHGRAYLVGPPPREAFSLGSYSEKKNKLHKELVNTRIGKSVNRELLTGAHVVADVSCVICGTVLGWKYVDAKEPAQKYKIGKFILETKRVVLGVCWEDGVVGTDLGDVEGGNGREEEDVVVFDSEDEDECEDLFAGVWDPELVAKRRGKRVNKRKKGGDNND